MNLPSFSFKDDKDNTSIADNVSQTKDKQLKKSVNVEDLDGRVCYFSLSGDLALQAYEETAFKLIKKNKERRLKESIFERLAFSVLMFDKTIMHCSDPLRSKMVYDILIECSLWIEDERIGFIFSDSINSVSDDYRCYIQRKINEYSEGYHSDKERSSLQKDFINDQYYADVINLLEKAKTLIRKPHDLKYSFDKIVLADLHHNVAQIIIDSMPNESTNIDGMNYTLYQLMKLQFFNKKRDVEYVFPEEVIDDVVGSVEEHLVGKSPIARCAIVEAIKLKLNKPLNRQQKAVLDAITLRMDVLYCRMNSGSRLILEFHPSYEKQSIYQIDNLKLFIREISSVNKSFLISLDLVNQLLSCDKKELWQFRHCFLSCIADANERKKINDIEDSFKCCLKDNKISEKSIYLFPSIKEKIAEVLL